MQPTAVTYVMLISGIECTPLTIKHSDTNNVRGFYQDSVNVSCDNGYQTDIDGTMLFEVQCGGDKSWINSAECQGITPESKLATLQQP